MKKSTWIFGGLATFLALVYWPRDVANVKPHTTAAPKPAAASSAPAPARAPLLSVAAAEQGTLPQATSETRPAPVPNQPHPTQAAAAPVDPRTACAAFDQWALQFLANPAAANLDAGRRLAAVRREALAREIRANPEGALKHAVSYKVRQALPPGIAAYLETVVSGRAELQVYCAYPLPGSDYRQFPGGQMRYVKMLDSGVVYAAYVYGRRVPQMGQPNIAVHGIAVGNSLALHEDPARELDADESAATFATGQVSSQTCALCGVSPANPDSARVLDLGGQLLPTCSSAHAADLNAAFAQAESAPRRVGLASPPPPSSGNPAWTNPPPVSPAYTFGQRRVLYMRVVFPDDTQVQISESEAARVMKEVNDFYVEASYNKVSIISTITPVLTLAQPKLFYAGAGPGAIVQDATAAAKAAGFDANNYDFLITRHPNVPGFDWGGLGGGNGRSGTVWLQSSGTGVTVHELGHVFGLGHANFWDTRRPAIPNNPQNLPFDIDSLVGHDSVIGIGDDVAYGDIFDVMGSGGGEGPAGGGQIASLDGHFNVIGKRNLGWLPEGYIATVNQAATNRIYVHDTPRLLEGRRYAVRVAKDAQRDYWISARGKYQDHRWLTNGVELHWAAWQQALGYSHLLDTTPGSANGRQDAAIALGRTYADLESKVFITPTARGGSGTNTWFDVVVFTGVATNNAPPELDLTASTNVIRPGGTVTLTATAIDADGDALAYYWTRSDGAAGPNAPTYTFAVNQTNEIVVRCEVSDMKGGLTSRHLVITVGNPGSLRIAGRVYDTFGQPVQNARVSNGALTDAPGYDYNTNYNWTYTDGNGEFTLVNIAAGSYALGAYFEGYITKPLNFDNPITLVDQDAGDVQFLATPRPIVTVQKVKDASATANTPGQFKLTRTGDTNTALQAVFLLGGTARAGTHYTDWTNSVAHTNVVPNPFGPVTIVRNFYAMDFPTGIVDMTLDIQPKAAATNGDEREVALTIMYPWQFMLTYLTNGDQGTLVTNTNWISYSDWQILTINGVDTWFQNYADYLPAFPGEARLKLKNNSSLGLPTVSAFAVVPNTSENQYDAGLITVVRSGTTAGALVVPVSIGGTATPGSDYETLVTNVVIPAGSTLASIPIIAREDFYLEGNETVVLTLVPQTNIYTVNSAAASSTVTITDNDMPLVTIAATAVIASENPGDDGAFVVSRIGDMTRPLVVNYLVSGDAVAGRDYRTLPGSVTIPAGQPSASIPVIARNNGVKDGGHTVQVLISDSPTYNVGPPSSASVFIQDSALPTVSVAATVATAVEPGTPGEFTVTRSGDVTRELIVNYRVAGNAKALADYASIGTKVRIAPGARSVTIPVNPVNDTFREDGEYIVIELLPNANYNLRDSFQAVINLNDEDSSSLPAVGFNFITSSGLEGSGSTVIAVTVSANPDDGRDVTVLYEVTGGTAILGVDYAVDARTGQVVFPHNPDNGPKGMATRTMIIAIPFTNNVIAQPDRTMVLTLKEPPSWISNWVSTNDITLTNESGEIITTNQVVTNQMIIGVPMNAQFDTYKSHTFTIVDDDSSIVTVQAVDPAAREEGLKAGLFRILRTGAADKPQVVNLQVTGAASAGSDFQPFPATITIPAGATNYDIPVYPVDDPIQEFMEDVKITLLSAPGGQLGGQNTASVNIVDNDGTIEFSQTEYFALENVGQALVPIRRTGDTSGTATVDFSVGLLTGAVSLTNGIATPDVDFVVTNGTVTFATGESVQYVPVTILDDTLVEPSESLSLTLNNQSGGAAIGGQTWAVLTVLDDDTSVEFVSATYRVNENATNALIALRRIGLADKAVTVQFAATDGTATNGFDFVATNRLVTFGATITNITVQVRILDDIVIQTDQTVLLSLATNAGSVCSVGPQTNATLAIAEDDCTLDFAAATYSADEFARVATVNVQRLGGTVNAVTVDYLTANGTALAGSDYVSARGTLAFAGDTNSLASDGSGTLVFQPGETNKVLDLRILDDNTGEGDETFTVTLSNPKGPARGTPAGATTLGTQTNTVVTIIDDETPGSVDFAFNPGQGANGPVRAVAVQSDGKAIIGGSFTAVDGVVLSRLARLHEDGYLDSFFNPGAGADAAILAIALQPDGRILVGGDFRFLDSQPLNRYARLNADGSVDTNLVVGFGADDAVRAIAVAADGGIYLAGDFGSIDGIARAGIARIDNAGNIDSSFDPTPGATGGVNALALQPDGKVLIAGAFTSAAGANYPYLARLNANGTADKSFASGTGPDAEVFSVAVGPDGKIVIGGAFTRFNGVTRAGIARLNPDGSLDTTFDPGTGANDVVRAVAVQADSKVLLAGAFTNLAGQAMNRFARLNPNGAIDSGFKIYAGADDLVRALALQPNTAFVIGGDFTTVNGLDRRGVARIHGDEKFVLSSIQFATANYRIGEKGGEATISVQRSGDIQSPASVRYNTADGTAIASQDYQAASGTINFAAGQTDASFKVKITDDKLAEGDETVLLLLTNLPSGYSPTGLHAAVLTIEDDESAVAFATANYTAVENAGKATITVRRSGPTTSVVSVDYTTRDGTATAGQDYQPASSTLTFAAGEVDKTFDVTLVDDTVGESDETVLVELSNPVGGGAVLGLQSTATLHIIDNDRVEFYSLNIAPPIGGSVTPASGPYPVNSVQVLTASADRDFAFTGWEGTTNSTANPLSVVMDRNYNLTAKFTPTTVTFTFEPPFTAGQLALPPWVNSATSPWQLQFGNAAAGNYCLRSGATGNGQDSTLELVADMRAGAVSFDLRVSSEANWDFFEFYLNGVRLQRWSGEVPWQNYRFNLPAGRNSLAWRYVKDANFSAGQDAAFIDNLYLPLNTPDPTPAAAVLTISSAGGGVLGIQLFGKTGLTYILQESPNLQTWTPIDTNVLTGTSTFFYVTPTTAKPIRFYRAVTP